MISIGSGAFNGVGINRVLIPASVTTIGSNVFTKTSSFKIYGERGSEAETYASNNNCDFIVINEIVIDGTPEEAELGSEHQLSATMLTGIDKYAAMFNWSVGGNISERTSISDEGLLMVGEDENAKSVTVRAMRGKYSSDAKITISGGTESTDLSEAAAEAIPDTEYTGEAIVPDVTVTLGETKLTEGEDYTVEYKHNTNAGEALAVCTGTGKYAGKLEIGFTILKAQNEWTEELSCADILTGEAASPSAAAKFGEVAYTYSTAEDGEFADTVPTEAGVYFVRATVSDTDNYSGLESVVSFTISEDPCAGGHELDKVDAVDATCTTDGHEEYYRCVNCGKLFADEAGDTEISEVPIIANPGHDWGEGEVTTPPTCTEEGVMTYICSRCGETETEAIEAKGHDWGEWTVIKEPTETEEGLEKRVCNNDDSHVKERSIPVIGHVHQLTAVDANSATCTEAGNEAYYICKECGRMFSDEAGETELDEIPAIAKLEHSWDDGTVTTEPGCTTEGEMTYTCDACGETKTEPVSALGHSLTETETKEESCKEAGNSAYWTCDRCGKYFSDAEGLTEIEKDSWVIPALGHKYVKETTRATLTANGSIVETCSVCDDVKTTTIYYPKAIKLSATAYTYNGKVRKPTVSVKDSKGSTVAATNYTVTYASGRKNVGSYKVTVKFKGNYSGTKTLTFKINPKGTTLGTPVAASRAATIKWTKQSTKMATSRITGYQIMLATNSTFTKGKKSVNVSGYSTVSKKVTGLTGGKRYYVKIRTYKTVSSKKYYSPWSKAKTVTIKK